MNAYLFPGQGSQFKGMGKDLYDANAIAKEYFDKANDILGFAISETMFNGSDDELKQTRITQPAIFIHSVAKAISLGDSFQPSMVAGHSLGEFSALVAAKSLSFEDGLKLVQQRALAMQDACEAQPSTMAAVLGLDDEKVEEICKQVDGIVVPANYNCPGQLVISGTVDAVNKACEMLKAAGAKRALVLNVGGAFHSPLMEPARVNLEKAIDGVSFHQPICPIYQNVNAKPETDPQRIKANLVAQLTAPVRWTQTIQNMAADGAAQFIECGPGNVLQGLVKKIVRDAQTAGA